MRRYLLVAFALIASAGWVLLATPANAQATRTWVSGVGNDADPCSRTAPCKTFAGAISKTAAKGEINCIDPGGFGAVTITKSISIICNNTEAGVLASLVNGIIINVAATDRVTLEGIDIDGFGNGINGVHIVGNGVVFIRNCSIRRFTGNGVNLVGTAGARVVVSDSNITYNNGGINVDGTGVSATSANIDNVYLDKNANFGVNVGATDNAVIHRTFMAGSTNSLVIAAGGQVISYGTNKLRNPGVPNQTLPRL